VIGPFAADTGFSLGDTYATGLLFLGLAVFAAIGALSHQHERAFSASLIYLGLGIAASIATSLLGIGWLEPLKDAKVLERASELAVVIALFSAGLKLDRPFTPRSWGTVARLLVIAMPLTIAGVALFGTAVLGLSLGAAIVLGAALAPTDPVLAGDVGVGPPGDEEEHEPNFAITAEGGLNDGLAFPFVLLGLFLAEQKPDWALEWLLWDVGYAVLAGVVIGAALGLGLAWSIKRLRDHELLIPALDGWVAVAATLAIYGLAEVAGGYGFLAVFVGGLAFRRYEQDHEVNGRVHTGAEMVEKFGELALILLLGSMLSLNGLQLPGVAGWALAAVLILVIRPVSVLVALVGSQVEDRGERWFVAWFGVRGVGTLFYASTAAVAGTLAGDEAATVLWTAIVCVIVSIVAHGMTASPLGRRLAPHSAS
jgi:NhaP-type Na+/H+ or K+/H+ antiporter